MAIKNTNISPLLKEGSNITLTQDGQVITIAANDTTGTPGGSNTQVQFNDSGSFGGDAGLTYNKTTNVLGVESIDFAQTPTAADAERRLHWDNDEGSLILTLKGGNVTIPLGQEVTSLVHNAEATTLTKGTVVYAYGASGQRVSVKKAVNTSDATSAQTYGVIAESIASGAEGFVMVQGMVRGIDTSAYVQGDAIYLSATAGQFTKTKPVAPNHLVYVGFVVKVNASSGEIFVRPQNGFEMNELHNYLEGSVQDKDVISYESSTSLYKPKSIATLLGYTPLNPTRTLTINGTAYDLSANRTWSVGTVTSVGITAGTGISVSGSPVTGSGSITVTNSAPDQTVSLTQGGTTTITGTYPNFTISSADQYSGTVTSVAALTLGTTGTDLSSTVANGTTTPVITLNVPTASATNRGALSSADWTTFNGKQAQLNGTGFVKASGTTISYDNSTYLTTSDASSTYLPLAGGTMTGNINWGQTDRGLTWSFNTDGASIKFYNTGDGDTNSRLEFNTSDNNDEYFRWTHSPSGGSLYELMKLVPVSSGNSELTVNGKIIKSGGTSSQFLKADGSVDSSSYYLASNPSGYTTNTGTVTSVGGTGTVNGITLTGTVTTSGNLTLGGTLSGVNLTSQVTGTLPVGNGGTGATAFTQGSVVFAGASGVYTQDNANFFWDDTNNRLGIGTASPNANLVVQNSSGTAIPSLGSHGGHFQLQNGTYGLLAGVATSGNAWMQVGRTDGTATAYNLLLQPNGGNVGIGTTNPTISILHLNYNSVNNRGIRLQDQNGVFDIITSGAGLSHSFGLYDDTNSAYRLFVTSGGNLLVGTTTDSGERLVVSGGNAKISSTLYSNLILDGTNTSDWGNNMAFRSQGTDFGYVGSTGSLLGNTTKDMTIWSTAGNGFRVYTNGNNLRLQIESTGAATFSSSVTAGGGFVSAGSPTGYPLGELKFSPTTNNSYAGISTFGTGSVQLYFDHRGTSNTGSFVWRNGTDGANTLMTLDASGRLGIGITSISSANHKLYVKGNANYNGTIVSSNGTTTGSGIFAVAQNETIHGYLTLEGSVQGNSSTNLSLFAETGNNITFFTNGSGTERMRLSTTGQLKLNAYTSSSSFPPSGSPAGYLAFDSSGNVLTTGNPASGSVTGSGTTNEIAYWSSSTSIASLSTSTYPSLTELSYVKGVTSSIQTQLNGKQSTLTNPVTGTGTQDYLVKFTSTGSAVGNSNIQVSGSAVTKFSTYNGANSDGYNIWIGSDGASSVGQVGNTILGSRNTSLGTLSMYYLTTGYQNVAVGYTAGEFINSGSNNETSYNSIYIGSDTRASANGNSNEIVIGTSGRGNGSNTATIGDSNITTYTNKINVTGGQITFPATQNASTDANTLDDYEEGTWTPALANTAASITYATNGQVGAYTKIGRQVTVTFRIATSTSTFTGNSLTITGIPASLTSQNTTNLEYVTAVAWSGSVTNFVNLQARIGASTTTITLWKTTAAGTSSQTTMVGSDIGNASVLQGTLTYFV